MLLDDKKLFMNYNIILRFLEYEKKDKYQRLSFFVIGALLTSIEKITQIYNFKEIQFFFNIAVFLYRKNIQKSLLQRKDLDFFEKYFVPEYETFLNAIMEKITNEKLKLEYEVIFKNYFENVFKIWILYNVIFYEIISILIIIFRVNTITKIEGGKQPFLDKIILNILMSVKM